MGPCGGRRGRGGGGGGGGLGVCDARYFAGSHRRPQWTTPDGHSPEAWRRLNARADAEIPESVLQSLNALTSWTKQFDAAQLANLPSPFGLGPSPVCCWFPCLSYPCFHFACPGPAKQSRSILQQANRFPRLLLRSSNSGCRESGPKSAASRPLGQGYCRPSARTHTHTHTHTHPKPYPLNPKPSTLRGTQAGCGD